MPPAAGVMARPAAQLVPSRGPSQPARVNARPAAGPQLPVSQAPWQPRAASTLGRCACAATPVSQQPAPEDGNDAPARVPGAFPAAVAVQTLRTVAVAAAAYAAFTPAASAGEYVWLPRRHHRRMDEWERTIPAVERVKEDWAKNGGKTDAVGVVKAKASELQSAVTNTQKSLREKAKSSQQEFTMSMKAAPTRTAADSKVLAGIPVLGWVAAAVALGAGWVLMKNPGLIGMGGDKRKGRWVRDRSMGGKMVFIPDDEDEPGAPAGGSRATKSSPLSEVGEADAAALTAAASKWGTAAATPAAAKAERAMPSWWDPPAYVWVPDERKVEIGKEARRLLKELEDVKLAGQDYPVWGLVELSNKCASGQVTVKPRTANGRDAMLRTGMEACIDAAMSGSNTNIGGLRPAQLASGLATALEVPEDKAKSITNGTIAGKTRSLLLSICAGFRAGDRNDILRPLMGLSGLLMAFPPSRGSPESDMLAASMKKAATLDERRGVLTLLFQMSPEAAPAAAEMLGFDPDMVMPLLQAGNTS